LTNVLFADGTGITNTYDLRNRLITQKDSAGRSVANWFDNQGLGYASSNYFGQVVNITLDSEDRPTAVTGPNGVTVNLTFDDLRRVLTRTYPDTGVEQFLYTAKGLVAYTNQLNR